MLNIDGSQGEGGGQIVRSSLALSLVTGTPVSISNIRAGRKKPGLMRQHMTAVRAAAKISRAKVTGNELGSTHLSFRPQAVRPGNYDFDIGTAGSTSLVVQTIVPALLLTAAPSRITVTGGTHNTLAPPFDFLERTFLPLVNRMGPHVTATLVQHGFYPAGGGSCKFEIQPAEKLIGFQLFDRGELVRRSVRAIVAKLPADVGRRELDTIAAASGWDRECFHLDEVRSLGPGNAVMIEMEFQNVTEVFTGFGERGVRAETVAANVWQEAKNYLDANVPVGPHLADQLLLPLSLAAHFGSAGEFQTLPLTDHSLTHLEILKQFLHVRIDVREQPTGETSVRLSPA